MTGSLSGVAAGTVGTAGGICISLSLKAKEGGRAESKPRPALFDPAAMHPKFRQ
jgi:hypothetical protein